MNLSLSWIDQSFCGSFYGCLAIITTLINLTLLLVHNSTIQNIESLPVASLSTSVDFKVSLIICTTAAVVVLFQYFANCIWLGKFSSSRIRVPGAECNILILLSLLLTNICSLFIVIPLKYYELQHCLNCIRLIWVTCFTFSYLNKYVGGLMTSPLVLLATFFFAISQILRFVEIFHNNELLIIIHFISVGFKFTSNSSYILLLYQWLCTIKHIKFENYTLRIYTCNVFVILLITFCICNWTAGLVYNSPVWYNTPVILNTINVYIIFIFIVGVTILQHSAATIDWAISLSEVSNIIFNYCISY